MKFLLYLMLFLPLMGCAFGQKTSFEGRSNFEFKPIEKSNAIVVVHDQRPYVQNGKKEPNFSGISKSLYGIPYDVTTQSGDSLAFAIGKMIARTMTYKGTMATADEIPYTWNYEDIKNNILGKAPEAEVYYIRMNEWKTETHFRLALHYDLQLGIYNGKGMKIRENKNAGLMYVDTSVVGRKNLAEVITTVLEELFEGAKSTEQIKKTSLSMRSSNNLAKTRSSHKNTKPKMTDEIREIIKTKCQSLYPDDFIQQVSCNQSQQNAWSELNP